MYTGAQTTWAVYDCIGQAPCTLLVHYCDRRDLQDYLEGVLRPRIAYRKDVDVGLVLCFSLEM